MWRGSAGVAAEKRYLFNRDVPRCFCSAAAVVVGFGIVQLEASRLNTRKSETIIVCCLI